jgi:hypothetical protein
MTEKEKRQLDSFRMQESYPADHDLPEEVERYKGILKWKFMTTSNKSWGYPSGWWRVYLRP